MRRLIGLLIISFIILIQFSVFTQGTELTHEERVLTFTEISKFDKSIVLNLPKEAEISYFGFELVGPVAPGPDQPWNLTLDIGDNGTIDWALRHEYGPLGYQKVFNDGAEELELRFIPANYNTSNGIYLPPNVEVSKASVELEYFDEDYISPVITELNRPEWHPEAPYDYDPNMCIYQDRLYLAYRSYGWHYTNQSDADIALNSTLDGVHWQDKTIELTKAPDTEVPYLGGKRSGDFNPSLAVFKNKLYCAWESDSTLPIGSTHDTDRDIVWTRYNGDGWLEPRELTAPGEQAEENTYSKNPGVKDDYAVQLCTFNNGTAEQLFAIWAANNTGDEKFPGSRIGDIIISHTADGEHWTTGRDLTADDKRYYVDYLPQLVEFKTTNGNALFAFWVTNNAEISNGTDWDIVYRYTLDGNTWSEPYNLIKRCGVTESDDDSEAIDDDPAVVVFNGKMYVLWRSSNPTISNDNDIDVVMACTPDGLNWSTPLELTLSTDTFFNNRPRAVGYKNKLITVWRTVVPDDEGAIILRVLDSETAEWREPITISPKGVGGNDYSPDIITFNEKIMVAWVTEDNSTTLGTDSDVVVRWLVPWNGTPEVALDIGQKGKYNENWVMPKTKLVEGTKRTIDFTDRLQELLQDRNWLDANTINDEFGYDLCFIPLNTYFSSPGRVMLSSLEIQYNYTVGVPDLSGALNGYLKESRDKDTGDEKGQDNNVHVKLRFDSISNGKVKIRNLKVKYTISEKPQQYPDLVCVILIGIVLIVTGLLIKFVKFGTKKDKKT